MILLHIEKLRSSLEASFMKLLVWRERHIKEKTFVIILALAVGILGGIAALVLKWLIHAISGFLTAHMSISQGNYLYLLLPLVGILITSLYVKYVVRDNISHGVTRVLYALSQNKSRLKKHNTYTSGLASSIWRFGWSRGADCVYRGSYRKQSRQSVQDVATYPDDPCRLWCCGRYSRYIQGSYCRHAFHYRGAYD